MPIYNYHCEDCGENFEVLKGVNSENSELKCKKCGSENVKKDFSTFNVNDSGGNFGSGPGCPTGTCSL